jgi:hypothetical protein
MVDERLDRGIGHVLTHGGMLDLVLEYARVLQTCEDFDGQFDRLNQKFPLHHVPQCD